MKALTIKVLSTILFLIIVSTLYGQGLYATKVGFISFYSDAPLEKIEAKNRQVLSIINTQSNEVAITVLMKSFDFEKALMQEHFNENYVESDKYPKAQFRGRILSPIDWTIEKEQLAEVEGKLSIHGKVNDVRIFVTVLKKANSIKATGKFTVALKDYNITIPSTVLRNIAEIIDVSFELIHNPYKP